ncbi:MAG: MATE family efflux transporter [Paludibacteraceae bacterium]|nr:MATE family efflux transporter [Paludibacteraceae bacterium]
MNTINRNILRLAIPSILANITIPLVGIVDTAIIGHISDAAAIGGIAIGTMLFDLLYWNFGFLRIGTSGLTAQAYGAGRMDECRALLQQGIRISLIAAVGIWLIQWFFVTAILWCVPCSPQAAAVAREYFFIRIWAAPATLILFTMKGWFIGMQDTRRPMVVDITVNGVNMIASYLLAVNAGLGVAGVAYGTLIAQYTGLVLAAILFYTRYSAFSFQKSAFSFQKSAFSIQLSDYFRFNANLVVRSLCFMIIYVGYTWLASRYGDTELAVSSILMKLFMFFSFFVDGFAYAGEALVGKAFGEAKAAVSIQHSAFSDIVRLLFNWAVGVGLLFTAVYALWGKACIGLLTDDRSVLDAAGHYIGWLIAMPIVSTLAFMWDGVYTGATAGKYIRNAMIWAAAAFAVLYVLSFRFVGAQALYIAYFAHLFARVVYLSVNWKKINIAQ